jgi:pseudaminic acid synthase
MSRHTFIIAELSANHNGNLETALESIRAIKKTGADAIKIQTYTADSITLNVKSDLFKIQGTVWDGQYLYDLYQQAYTPWEWHAEIFDCARKEGLVCFSSPFDIAAVDLLEKLNCPIYKIASMEITDIPLIEYAASKRKPMIISTGIANADDIELAINTCKKAGSSDITLLQCTSEYPAKPEDANLLMIQDMALRFGVKTGLSDHTMGIVAPVVAVSLGATVIEKHFILDRNVGGPDAHFSLNAGEFTAMVSAVRDAEKMFGKISYELTDKMIKSRHFSRSLFISEDVKEGDIVSSKNIRSVRPGVGLHPKYYKEVLGKKFAANLQKGTPLKMEHLTT